MNYAESIRNNDLAILLLRIGVGVIFIVSGWGKLTGIEGTQGFFDGLGIPAAGLMAWVVAIVEFFGGFMVLTGTYIRIPTPLLAIIMLVAIITVQFARGWGSMRLELMLMIASLALFLTGSGKYSVDQMISTSRRMPETGRALGR